MQWLQVESSQEKEEAVAQVQYGQHCRLGAAAPENTKMVSLWRSSQGKRCRCAIVEKIT